MEKDIVETENKTQLEKAIIFIREMLDVFKRFDICNTASFTLRKHMEDETPRFTSSERNVLDSEVERLNKELDGELIIVLKSDESFIIAKRGYENYPL